MNSLIVVGILALEEDAKNFCQGYHTGARKKAVPGVKTKAAVESESLFFEIVVMMNEKLWQQGEQQDHDLDNPEPGQVFFAIKPVFTFRH